MAEIRFDEAKLRENEQGDDAGRIVRIMPQNTPYPHPSFVTDGSGDEAPGFNAERWGVDVYPEAIDEETARIVHEF